jgi:capsular polysaccharide biosynthesis protein
MRYLILTYYKKADGKIDEAMAVSRRIKTGDLQMANVILDFKELKVVKCSMGTVQIPKDWDRVLAYYHQHYASTIERLLQENGYEIVKPESA